MDDPMGDELEPIEIGGGPDPEADLRRALAELEARRASRGQSNRGQGKPPEQGEGSAQAPAKAQRKGGTGGRSQSAAPQTSGAQASAPRAARAAPALPTVHRPLTLLEVADPADLDALMADPRVSALVALRPDPRAALVLPEDEARLMAALRKAGHTPRVLDHAPPPGPPEDGA